MSKKTPLLAGLVILLALVVMTGLAVKAQPGGDKPVQAPNLAKVKEFRIERSMSKQAQACIECHKIESPGIFADWAHSRHASANITCLDCHQAEEFDPDVSQVHYKQYERGDSKWGAREYRVPVSAVVSPKDCSRCHPDEAKQYAASKHANTIEIMWKIDPWLNAGQNSDFERQAGCFHCHGTVVAVKDGKLDPATWPNVGVGRLNMDGSKGSCAACHTRHKFSVAEARQPDTCGQCHLGPDHPQIEIWNESKHGAIYRSEYTKWNFAAAPGTWTPGTDYRAPTCAACHMSGSGVVRTTHDVTERLAWEAQAPLTVRPNEFAAFPATTDWKVERDKMKQVCLACHGQQWVDDHFTKYDAVIVNYNDNYYKPALAKLEELYQKGLMDPKGFFRQPLFTEFYELWHHEGRRARFGAAMMAPDYAWWHGFYECKKRYVSFMKEADHLIKTGEKAYLAPVLPGATGNTTRPVQIFGKPPAK